MHLAIFKKYKLIFSVISQLELVHYQIFIRAMLLIMIVMITQVILKLLMDLVIITDHNGFGFMVII
jgi:hypothetical protein